MSEQPPGEHSTRDPWPEGFEVPTRAAGFRKKLRGLDWDARIGYSRAYLKVSRRGEPGTSLLTSWVLHHFVRVQARRNGRELHAMWRALAVLGGLSWKFDSGIVQGLPATWTRVSLEGSAPISSHVD
jgi:hypothetical protein